MIGTRATPQDIFRIYRQIHGDAVPVRITKQEFEMYDGWTERPEVIEARYQRILKAREIARQNTNYETCRADQEESDNIQKNIDFDKINEIEL